MSMASRIIIAIVLVLLFGALWAWLAPAKAQGVCCPVKDIVGVVTGPKYRERAVSEMTIGGVPAKLFVNGSTGTWTIITFMPGGACGILGGKDFKQTAQPTSDEM